MPERRHRNIPFDFEIWIGGFFGTKPFSLRITPERISRPPGEREPLVDVVVEEKFVKVVAELPGAEKEKIDLVATETSLTISAESPYGKYYKDVILPVKVDPKSGRATYRNGVLEVLLAKAKGERIPIE